MKPDQAGLSGIPPDDQKLHVQQNVQLADQKLQLLPSEVWMLLGEPRMVHDVPALRLGPRASNAMQCNAKQGYRSESP